MFGLCWFSGGRGRRCGISNCEYKGRFGVEVWYSVGMIGNLHAYETEDLAMIPTYQSVALGTCPTFGRYKNIFL